MVIDSLSSSSQSSFYFFFCFPVLQFWSAVKVQQKSKIEIRDRDAELYMRRVRVSTESTPANACYTTSYIISALQSPKHLCKPRFGSPCLAQWLKKSSKKMHASRPASVYSESSSRLEDRCIRTSGSGKRISLEGNRIWESLPYSPTIR